MVRKASCYSCSPPVGEKNSWKHMEDNNRINSVEVIWHSRLGVNNKIKINYSVPGDGEDEYTWAQTVLQLK